MTQEIFTRDELGNRVFVFNPDSETTKFEGGEFSITRSYKATTGKRSKYPTIVMGVGDRVFVEGGKAHTKDLVYMSAVNRRALDPSFDYVAHAGRLDGVRGLMIRCVERKQPT